MDINVKTSKEIDYFHYCYISGISNTDPYGEQETAEFNNCVYSGTIQIGDAGHKAIIYYLKTSGIANNGNKVNGCAFYGKFLIHSTIRRDLGRIASIATKCTIGDDYKQNVVYSVGNVINVNVDTTLGADFQIDKVCNLLYNGNKKHKDYYCFEASGVDNIECKYTEDQSTYAKTLADLKAEGFINTLNTNAGKTIWGKLKGTNSVLDGLPMPIGCGGVVTEYEGEGTAKEPWILSSEADLKALQTSVNGGQSMAGKYFKLGSDISMSGTMNSIGTSTYPFKGHFDGNGYAIVGLRNTLFGYMYGTVKNLAIVDCNINALVTIGALARYVGSSDCKAEISNCYVNGTVYTTPSSDIKLAGFCYDLYSGSSIHDCYFKGLFVPQDNGINGSYYISGIAYDGSSSTVGETTKPGIYNCYASFDVKASGSFTIKQVAGISYTGSSNSCSECYAVSKSNFSNSGDCTKLSSESGLNEKFSGKTGWLQGVYRPLLASAKHYTATSPDNETAYFDAIPEANPTKNYIYNVTVSGDPYADKTVWELPNMAVYVESEQMDYITNGYLDQSANFQYKRSADATATAGQLRYDLTQSEKGYHLVCLPGMVEKSDLPAGTKVMIVGNVSPEEGTEQQVNVVMVEDIPAGVPCFVYVPTETVTKGTTIPLVMRSGIVSEPQNETYGSLNGTFSKDTSVPAGSCVSAAYKEEDSKLPYFIRTKEATTAQPFTAWLTGANGDVKIVDYVLLDEENGAMTVTLAELNKQKTNLKMRRTLKTNSWNTICLPYSLSSDEISSLFGSGTKVEAFSDLEYKSETNTYTLKFTAATAIAAGTPYLIKPATAKADNIFEMQNKTIACASATTLPTGTTKTVNTTTLTMQGEYNHRMISPDEATDVKSLYVISGNKIYYVDSNVEMKGFRCYFVAQDAMEPTNAAKLFSGARLMHSDGTSTELRLIKAEPTGDADAVYDLLGRKSNGQTKGVVIKNGKKVF